ncbi:unnamed protein product, partial [Rotaria sp. Silwood1]
MMSTDPSNMDTEDDLLQPEILDNALTKPKIIPISTKYGYVI